MIHFVSNPVCFINEMAHSIKVEVTMSEKSGSSRLFDHGDKTVEGIWGFSIKGVLLA